MDLENGTNTLDKVDGFLTKFGTVLKKHWGKLILIGIGIVVWWFGREILNEYNNITEDTYIEEYEEYNDESTDYIVE
jgi:hypothetical protein